MRFVFRFLFRALVPLLILGGVGYQTYRMVMTPEKARKTQPTSAVPLVTVADLVPGDVSVSIEAYGTVGAAREVLMRSQVGGRILEVAQQMAPGGFLKQGEILVQIDPTDYQIALERAEAMLAQSKADYDIEQGQQVIARRGWELLKEDLSASAANQDLALRKPQLQRAEAERAVAETELEEARVDLERTKVTAPFDAVVIRESVEIGQLVQSQDELATLVGTDEFWIRALVPLDMLDRVQFRGADGTPGSEVRVTLSVGSESQVVRNGEVLRLVGDLDTRGRMARVLIAVQDPYGLETPPASVDEKSGKLLVGSYVRLDIQAGAFEGVYSIPRTALRENSRVWVRTGEGKLQIKDVDVVWRQEDDVLVTDAFEPGEQLITSRLSRVMPGMEVRARKSAPVLADDKTPPDESEVAIEEKVSPQS